MRYPATEDEYRRETFRMQRIGMILQVLATGVVLYIGWNAFKKNNKGKWR